MKRYQFVTIAEDTEHIYWKCLLTGALVCRIIAAELRALVTQK